MTARCPFCEAVHPVPAGALGRELHCPCRAMAVFCAPSTEPETAVHLAERGLDDTKADVVDDRLSIVWGREWRWRRIQER